MFTGFVASFAAKSLTRTPVAPAAGKRRDRDYQVIDDRRTAIAAAIDTAAAGDTVVLAGKGHEGSIIVGEEKRPWDEAAAAREALQARGFDG